ncbi:uncharacterized protein A1O9_08700 [Exophiala aquamarina CBS 119918]|uniref:Very long-chain fatty acid transport protein n=1 Tax=Exophiala aquamarina CBS 119918 TaxID=1182545 RepID=A0A072P5P8_9EURO|nr:uncharacterized protein A1O9_08700 [Exophiala aquamarina CBS 119918]KEF55047.1 hypothetical protein A1O9_08700 [Exophiala aquamarina CBS 119918]
MASAALSSISGATLAAAAPAALAGLAYLNARWRVSLDLHMARSMLGAILAWKRLERTKQINSFYRLEEYAHSAAIKDEPFLVYQGQSWSFHESYRIILRYARYLHVRHAIQPGDIVALDFMNSPQFMFVVLAVWSLGAVPATVNYNLVNEAFVHSVRTCRARLLVVEPEVEARVLTDETRSVIQAAGFRGHDALPLEIVVLTEELQSSLEVENENEPPFRAPDTARSNATARTPAILIFTSGTTGLPKAAIVPWQRMVLGSGIMHRWMGVKPVTSKSPDRLYVCMPLYHGTAFLLGFSLCLEATATLVIGRKFSASKFWDDVAASDATVVSYVGETLRYLLAAPPRPNDSTKHRVRLAVGNGLRPDVWDHFKERFGIETIAEFYGATESVSASWNLNRNSFSSGAIGQVGLLFDLYYSKTQAIVEIDWEVEAPRRDPETRFCTQVPRGEPGELLYALDAADVASTYQGYFGNQKASDSKVWRNVFKKGDAWFRSGDVVRFDKEGRMWFSDRIGDTFRWRSENVSTNEVAEVLGRHPAVIEANVYGVEIPNHDGRAGCAATLLHGITTANDGLVLDQSLLKDLADHARKELPKYAVPVFLRLVTELKATGNNKQQKHIMRAEGVDPARVSAGDRIFYLRPENDRFEVFGVKEWEELQAGRVKL